MPVAKAYAKASAEIEPDKAYSVEEAVAVAKRVAHAKFDETVEMAIRLGVNPKHADQMVRGAVLLPHGTGKTVRVVAFAKGEKEREAREAGADVVGAEDLVEKIQGGWLEFDTAVATPDLMGQVGRLGKILGPRGLMPNPKVGTVTFDVARAIREVKAGKVEFKVDKAGNVHVPVGKRSFAADAPGGQRERDHRGAREGEARRRQGAVSAEHHGVDDDGARCARRRPAHRQPIQAVGRPGCPRQRRQSRSRRFGSGWAGPLPPS